MTLEKPSCPTCGSPLTKTVNGALDSWICGGGHGLAITLSESDRNTFTERFYHRMSGHPHLVGFAGKVL